MAEFFPPPKAVFSGICGYFENSAINQIPQTPYFASYWFYCPNNIANTFGLIKESLDSREVKSVSFQRAVIDVFTIK